MEEKEWDRRLGDIEAKIHELYGQVGKCTGIATGNGQILNEVLQALETIYSNIENLKQEIREIKKS